LGGIAREKRACDAEVEYKAVRFSQTLRDERRRGWLVLNEPFFCFWRMRIGRKAASGAEGVVRKARMNLGEAVESRPCRCFGDSEVGIAGDERLAMSGVDYTDGKASSQKWKERGDFLLSDRVDAMIGGKDRGGSGERIVVVKDGVGSGDGGLGNREGFVHVTEVADRENQTGLRPRRRNEGVVIVGVAVDDATTKVRNPGQGFTFEEVQEIRGEGALLGIFDVREKLAGPEGTRDVPLEIAFGKGVRKVKESDVDFGEEAAEAFEKFQGMRIGLRKDRAGYKREKPNETRGAIGDLSLRKEFALERGADARKRKMGSTLGKMSKRATLHVDECLFAGRMHDLQDIFSGVTGDEVEIVVVLAREGMRNDVDVVKGKSEARGIEWRDWSSDTCFGHEHGEIVSREWVKRQMRSGA